VKLNRITAIAAIAGLAAASFALLGAHHETGMMFNSQGDLLQPKGYVWRSWVQVGTPVTPNSLNAGAAPFPEFHNVYMPHEDFAHYQKTGEFRDGTVLIKELTSVGATQALSGNGFFQGEYIGLEATIKDSKRFAKEPGNWAYFTFSHEAPPYPASAKQQPTGACNACHDAGTQTGVAEDFVFTAYYPVLRAAKPAK